MAFELQQPVLFRHCDPAGLVYYPRYFEMISDCVEAYFATCLNIPFADLHQTAAVPTAHFDVTFTAPSRHGDMLVLGLTPEKIGRSSFAFDITARCKSEVRFVSKQTIVHVDDTGAPQPWLAATRSIIQQQLGVQ